MRLKPTHMAKTKKGAKGPSIKAQVAALMDQGYDDVAQIAEQLGLTTQQVHAARSHIRKSVITEGADIGTYAGTVRTALPDAKPITIATTSGTIALTLQGDFELRILPNAVHIEW